MFERGQHGRLALGSDDPDALVTLLIAPRIFGGEFGFANPAGASCNGKMLLIADNRSNMGVFNQLRERRDLIITPDDVSWSKGKVVD